MNREEPDRDIKRICTATEPQTGLEIDIVVVRYFETRKFVDGTTARFVSRTKLKTANGQPLIWEESDGSIRAVSRVGRPITLVPQISPAELAEAIAAAEQP